MYTVIDSNLKTNAVSPPKAVSDRNETIAELRKNAVRLNKSITELNGVVRNQTQKIMVLEFRLAKISNHVSLAYKETQKGVDG